MFDLYDYMRNVCFDHYKIYFGHNNLNIGSAKNLEVTRGKYGFINLDRNPLTNAEIIHDLDVLPLPFPDNTFDAVVGSHIF
jgi:hypothetical protein